MSGAIENRNKIKEKTGNRSKNRSGVKKSLFGSWFLPHSVERLKIILAFITGMSGVVIFISLLSFLFTWQADYDKLTGSWLSVFIRMDITVENWMGKIGAVIAQILINHTFGIASFVIPFLLILFCIRLGFGIWLLPPSRTLTFSLFALVYIATILGYFFQNSFFLPGGNYGLIINQWLLSVFGKAGVPLVLFSTLVLFILSAFKFQLPRISLEGVSAAENEEEIVSHNRLKETGDDKPSEVDNPPAEVVSISTELSLNNTAVEETMPDNGNISDTDHLPINPTAGEQQANKNNKNKEMEVNLTGTAAVLETTIASEEENSAADDPELAWQKTLQQFGKFDPTLELGSYQPPAPDLLENHSNRHPASREELMAELEANKDRIVETLGHYNISIEKIKATVGPTVTLFEIVPKAGIRISRIKSLEDDIALSLSALGIRIIAPIPGKGTIGIEVPNQRREIVSIKSILTSERFQQCHYELPIGLGRTIANEVFVADLTLMPHLLIAGATGQGKSVGLNVILLSLLYKKHPAEVKFVLVDPKKVELTLYKKIERHFLARLPGEEEPIITETRKVVNTLNSLCIEMNKRYNLLKEAQVRNIKEYNERFIQRRLNPNEGHSYLPYIVLVIDEFADLIMMAGKEIETPIARIAQMARAVGIHLIIATQRPSVNIITGTIKANFPARMAFRVTSRIDSRTILDSGGAEQLIGSGDMLLAAGGDLIRLQCAYADIAEVDRVTEFIGSQRGYPNAFMLPEYNDENEESALQSLENEERDPLFEEAARIIVQYQQGSASLLQRKLKLGYNRAGRIIDQLEAAGIIGPFEGSKAREVKIKDLISLEQLLNSPYSNDQ